MNWNKNECANGVRQSKGKKWIKQKKKYSRKKAIWYLCKQNKINVIYFWTNDHRNKYELINQLLLFIVNILKWEWRFFFEYYMREYFAGTFIVMLWWMTDVISTNSMNRPSDRIRCSIKDSVYSFDFILIALRLRHLSPPLRILLLSAFVAVSNTWRQFVTQ